MKKIILIAFAIIFTVATTLPAAAEKLKPGDKFYHCDNCPEMVVLPAGSFMMGSPADEKGREYNEGPLHKVTIDYQFAVGVYEVTFSEWDYCVQQGGCNYHRPNDEGWGRGDRPVINVNWRDAKAYVKWLSRETGEEYRLLSEAEWEYAARAGTTTPFHFGNTISTNQANYRTFKSFQDVWQERFGTASPSFAAGYRESYDAYSPGSEGSYRGATIPVGLLPPNKFGLHDMHGNVWEWVEDCWHDHYRRAPTDGSAWFKGGDCGNRVKRGGSWADRPGHLRSACRGGRVTDYRYVYLGFRVAMTLTP